MSRPSFGSVIEASILQVYLRLNVPHGEALPTLGNAVGDYFVKTPEFIPYLWNGEEWAVAGGSGGGGGGEGTVTSIAFSGGTTGLTASGGPITDSGTFTLAGTLALTHGGTGATTASDARSNLGLGALAVLGSVNNTNWSGTALAVGNGGTGATTASGARTNLGLGALAVLSTVDNALWSGTPLSVANGGTAASTAGGARTNLGLGALAVLSSVDDSNWSGTDLAVANGGTGASTAAGARSNLGLGLLALFSSIDDSLWFGTPLAVSHGGTGATTAAGARSNLGLGALAVLSTVNNSDWSGTALALSNGGTGATTAADARTNLGLGALAVLSSVNDSNWSGTALAVGNGGTGATTAAGARTNLGLGALAVLGSVDDSNWSGTALALTHGGTGATTAAGARSNLGLGSLAVLSSVNDSNWSGTALAVSNGGTGATTAGAARTNLGLGALAVLNTVNDSNWSGTALALTNGGTGATTAADARTNLGLGTLATLSSINDANWSGTALAIANGGTGATTAANARTNLGLGSLAVLSTINDSNWSGTALAIGNGGTGATTAAGARTNLGLVIGTDVAAQLHAAQHKHTGTDEIATATPAANVIPKTGAGGVLDSWISDASTSAKGLVKLARDLRGTALLPEVTGFHGRDFLDSTPIDLQVPAWIAGNSRYELRRFGVVSETVIPPSATADVCPTLLVAQQRSAAPGLYRLAGGVTLTGPLNAQTFDAVESGSPSILNVTTTDAIEYNGKHYVVHTVSTTSYGVWERQSDGTWTRVQTLTQTAAAGLRTGLFISNDGTTRILCYLALGSAGNPAVTLCKTSDGTSWTNTSLGATSTSGSTATFVPSSAITHRGVLYVALKSNSTGHFAVAVNVAGASMSGINTPVTANCPGWWVTIYGRVFCFASHALYEYTGGSLVSRATVGNGGSSGTVPGATGAALIFADGTTKLLVIYPTSTGNTVATSYWRAADIVFASSSDIAPTVTQRDSLVPATMASGGATSNKANGGFWGYIDTETVPGNPQVYGWWTTAVASTLTHFKYVNSTTELSGSPFAVTAQDFSLPAWRQGSGEHISQDDTTDVRFTLFQTAVGTGGLSTWLVSWKFTALSTSLTYTARVFISTPEGTQYSEATLKGTAIGGTRSGNTVTGCPHNTLCSVNVDVGAMGIAANTPVRVIVKVYQE